jgi:hypothetical protein
MLTAATGDHAARALSGQVLAPMSGTTGPGDRTLPSLPSLLSLSQ